MPAFGVEAADGVPGSRRRTPDVQVTGAADRLSPVVAVEVRQDRLVGEVQAVRGGLGPQAERRLALTVPIGHDDAAARAVAQALQPARDEELDALRRVGGIGEDQVRAAEGRLGKPETQIAEQAPDG